MKREERREEEKETGEGKETRTRPTDLKTIALESDSVCSSESLSLTLPVFTSEERETYHFFTSRETKIREIAETSFISSYSLETL